MLGKSISLSYCKCKEYYCITNKIVAAFEECMCHLGNIPLESVTEKCDRWTDRQTDRQTDGQTTDKVIPMCRYASQATQKLCEDENFGLTWRFNIGHVFGFWFMLLFIGGIVVIQYVEHGLWILLLFPYGNVGLG